MRVLSRSFIERTETQNEEGCMLSRETEERGQAGRSKCILRVHEQRRMPKENYLGNPPRRMGGSNSQELAGKLKLQVAEE